MSRETPVSAGARAADDPLWRDGDGAPITVGCRVEQIWIDAELGAALPAGQTGPVLRRSATRPVVRFEGETTLARIRPQLLRVVSDSNADPDPAPSLPLPGWITPQWSAFGSSHACDKKLEWEGRTEFRCHSAVIPISSGQPTLE